MEDFGIPYFILGNEYRDNHILCEVENEFQSVGHWRQGGDCYVFGKFALALRTTSQRATGDIVLGEMLSGDSGNSLQHLTWHQCLQIKVCPCLSTAHLCSSAHWPRFPLGWLFHVLFDWLSQRSAELV